MRGDWLADPGITDFDVSGSASSSRPAKPAFKAHCCGFGEGAPFSQCNVLDGGDYGQQVAAQLLAANMTGAGARIAVSYQYIDTDMP